MGFKPSSDMRPICPRCGNYIGDEPTGKLAPYGSLFHATCVEEIEQAEAEIAQVREATK